MSPDPVARYEIAPVRGDFDVGGPPAVWREAAPLSIDHYLWLHNGYEPRVEARLLYSEKFLYVRFDVGEGRVRARYTRFQDPVYKDSCVEFFVDAFPALGRGYLNLETNALGTLLAAFGPDRERRKPLSKGDLKGFAVSSTVKASVDGEIAAGRWALAYRIPLGLFRKLYGQEIVPGVAAAANFYKCGDETAVPHYGAWSPVGTPRPDFHRPEYFGRLVFGKP